MEIITNTTAPAPALTQLPEAADKAAWAAADKLRKTIERHADRSLTRPGSVNHEAAMFATYAAPLEVLEASGSLDPRTLCIVALLLDRARGLARNVPVDRLGCHVVVNELDWLARSFVRQHHAAAVVAVADAEAQ